MTQDTPKPWGGRFSVPTDKFVEQFTESVSFDKRLYHFDIQASIAHANSLVAARVLTSDERDSIVQGLNEIEQEIDRGEFEWKVTLEDVHMNIETRLVELIGETGKKLHTGRSRNDQVATDLRLWLRDAVDRIDEQMTQLLEELTKKAEEHIDTIMPGFTHLQNAQPITFAHHLMAWFEMLFRDRERLRDCRKRINHSPLGAAALAGTSYPLLREQSAKELQFAEPIRNSLDAVSDRDFVLEFAAVASLAAVHLSRWCEEIILWNSSLVGFVELPDEYCTGSSIMPQKKNPDVAELIRGKSGRIIGDLMALLTLVKGQPLAYNRDNQEDKEPIFDVVETLQNCLTALCGLIPEIQPRKDRLLEAAAEGFATATDLADWLVNKGVSFRDAHNLVGRVVALAESENLRLEQLSLGALQSIDARFDASVFEVLSVEASVASRSTFGGTAPNTVRKAVQDARNRIQA